MKIRALSLSFAAVASFLVACSAAPTDNTGSSADQSDALTLGSQVHALKPFKAEFVDDTVSAAAATPPAASTPKLVNYGGPVIPKVNVIPVFWGTGVSDVDHTTAFYKAVVNSKYYDWLKEYNTSTQSITRGTFGGAVTITPKNTAKTITDADVQKEINDQITAGTLPKADGVNNYYPVHFPPGITITMSDGSASCVQFCAYHGTFKRGSKDVFYGVMPDLATGGCEQGCGGGALQDNETEVASHELIEATTDPAVGLATTYGPPLAWYDQTNGEIGDICVGKVGTHGVTGFTVQLEWSNSRGRCISH